MLKNIKEYLWGVLAKMLAKPAVSDWLINKALNTPWVPIPGIMDRYWLFNPYYEIDGNGGEEKKRSAFWDLLPTIRIHHILGHDQDPHLHDHPWDCRTIILRGFYSEKVFNPEFEPMILTSNSNKEFNYRIRRGGDTASLGPNKYHKISYVKLGYGKDKGAWTLFITWKYQEAWGFMVDGKKMLSRDYFKYRRPWRPDLK